MYGTLKPCLLLAIDEDDELLDEAGLESTRPD